MKTILLTVTSAALLSACAAPGPETAWGKPGISNVDYVTDLGTCSAKYAMTENGNEANTAGGINGRNNRSAVSVGAETAKSAGTGGGGAGAAVPTGGNGIYRDSTPVDVVNRAATQEQTQKLEEQRKRTEALKSCYVEHGYQEFKLTPEQRKRLGSLEKGSNEYLHYLAEIGTDPASIKRQSVPRTGS